MSNGLLASTTDEAHCRRADRERRKEDVVAAKISLGRWI